MPKRSSEKIIPIILAAGPSPNLPFPKALAHFGRKTALQIAISNCKALGTLIVVLGSDARIIHRHIPMSVPVITNLHWRNGQLSSLQAALKKIPRDAAFMIYPVDHPLIRPATIRQLVHAFRTRSAKQEIVMPRHKSAYGHPVIVSKTVRPEFFSAPTAREVIYRHPGRLRILEVATPSIFQDFHSPESYKRCLKKFDSRLARSTQTTDRASM
jgi:CTP:molybdopterin cytidylyltransferase MocA